MENNQEYIETLKKTFVKNLDQNISVDGWTSDFLKETAQFGIDQGWLTSIFIEGHQYSYYSMCLTDKGKAFFKLFK